MKMRKDPVIFLLFFGVVFGLVPVFHVRAQTNAAAGTAGRPTAVVTIPDQAAANQSKKAPAAPKPLPRQFRGISLGMSLDDLKTALAKDGLFSFRGDRDVSFLPIREQTLVETRGISFIRRAYFQLAGGAVFIMSFSLDTRQMDHYSVFTTLVKKYGPPKSLNPGEAVWETEDTRLSIERPLTVKYVDKKVFNRLVEESNSLNNNELMLREEFLGNF